MTKLGLSLWPDLPKILDDQAANLPPFNGWGVVLFHRLTE